jgi:hypothetical protein
MRLIVDQGFYPAQGGSAFAALQQGEEHLYLEVQHSKGVRSHPSQEWAIHLVEWLQVLEGSDP